MLHVKLLQRGENIEALNEIYYRSFKLYASKVFNIIFIRILIPR